MSHQYQYQSPWTRTTSTLDAALSGGGSVGAQATSLHTGWPRRLSKGPGPPCPQGGSAGLCHHPAEMSPRPCSRTKCSHIHTMCSQLSALTACSQPSAYSTSSPSFLAHTCSVPSTLTRSHTHIYELGAPRPLVWEELESGHQGPDSDSSQN